MDASMGPLSPEHGNFALARLSALLPNASMGPHPPECGNLGYVLRLIPQVPLQLGRTHPSTETEDLEELNGDYARLQWGRTHLSAET